MENEKHTKKAVESVGGILIGIILICWFIVWPEIFPTEIGSYPAMRAEDGNLIPLNRIIYKVNPLMQTIIYWMPGVQETPQKLVNCAVRDRKNWIGYYTDDSGAVEMRKGRIVTDDPNDIYVGRYRWWLLHFEILH